MLEWEFILNPGTDNLVTDEPVGWADMDVSILRDPKFHGISIAFGTKELEFIGEAADLIKAAYEADGTEAIVTMQVLLKCDDVVEYRETFALDFNTYESKCGTKCTVSIGFEQKSCFQLVNSNIQKPVNADNEFAFDGVTALEQYDWLQREITLPAVSILAQDRAEATTDQQVKDIKADPDFVCNGCVNNTWFGYFLPGLPDTKFSALGVFNPSPSPMLLRYNGANNHPPWEVDMTVNTDTLDDNIKCNFSSTVASFRLKGNVQISVHGAGQPGVTMRVKIFRLPVGLSESNPNNWVQEYSQDLVNTRAGGSGTYNFDLSGSVNISMQQGDLVHFGMFFNVDRFSQIDSLVWTQDASAPDDITNFFDLSTKTLCENSTAKVYAVYELLSRLTEAISNKCMRVESEYYGRTDSQPNEYGQDGCGSLRVITSGLYIRKAEKPVLSLSLYELLDGLNGIDNIGFAMQKNVSNEDLLKIEPVTYFYQKNTEILRCPFVGDVSKKAKPDESIGTITSGYEKWQPLNINGLDEFNSTREHRLNLNNSATKLAIVSKLVAAGYAIETTRQQSFITTGGADTTYDNDNFILCMKRSAYEMVVEQGGIQDPDELIDPDTVLNFRISPLRNLMRWYKSIIGSYRQVNVSTTKIEFVSGTGNFSAKGYYDDACAVEAQPPTPAENANVIGDGIKAADDRTPLFRPEIDTFEYPLSLNDFLNIRANPYGYISYQCGNGEWKKGFIRSIKYGIGTGKATYELRTLHE